MLASVAGLVLAAMPVGTVVMIHGAGGGGWEYDYWAAEYRKAGWTVVAKDLVPAKGGLEKTAFADYVQQVKGWAAKARRPLVLVGASMGGALALKAAEDLKPDALILVNSVPPKGLWDREQAKPNPPVVKWAGGPLQDTRDSMPDSDEKTILWAWKKWRDESGAVMDELRAGIETRKPDCPVLVVIGAKDADIPPAVSLKVADRFKADVFQFAGMSHVGPLMSTRAREVAQDTLRWLEARLARP
jgi:pimeloyl-ACP methyl ester carboxylesterase